MISSTSLFTGSKVVCMLTTLLGQLPKEVWSALF